MNIRDLFRRGPGQTRNARPGIAVAITDNGDICCPGYTSLDKCPEIVAGIYAIAKLLGSITIYLMSNSWDTAPLGLWVLNVGNANFCSSGILDT